MRIDKGDRKSAFVVSLDFELHWGVRDIYRGGDAYMQNLHGARVAIPQVLELFARYEVACTWATVGFLFARSAAELAETRPSITPKYDNPALDPYQQQVGANEANDPLHFAGSLVEQIQQYPNQEIATHTYSHYYCGEPGQDGAAFAADLDSAICIAKRKGISLKSIVFPRNQHNPEYDRILRSHGIRCYRGNPPSALYNFADSSDASHPLRRIGRAVDSCVRLSGHNAKRWDAVLQPSGLSDVAASSFLRPYEPRFPLLTRLRQRRITRSLQAAADAGEIFHLWWHPHNFGVHIAQNLAMLEYILQKWRSLRDSHGMRSLTMAQVDEEVRSGVSDP